MKNYVVIIDNVETKGVRFLADYFVSNSHKNHKKTEEIINLSNIDYKDFLTNINQPKIDANLSLIKPGPKLKLSNKTLTFDIPKDYDVTKEQIEKIYKLLEIDIINIYKENGFTINSEDIFSVIHLQENSHIHSLLPLVDKDSFLKMKCVDHPNFTKKLKEVWTNRVDEVLGTNINDYMVQAEQEQQIDEHIDKLDDLTLEDIQVLKEKHKSQKKLKRMYDYIYKIKSKQIEQKEFKRDLDLLKKTFVKVVNEELSEELIEELQSTFTKLNIYDEFALLYNQNIKLKKTIKEWEIYNNKKDVEMEKLKQEIYNLKNPNKKSKRR